MKKAIIRATLIASSLGLLSGCATTAQLEEVRGIANQALTEARGASQAAADAKAAADAAQACCNETQQKLDRMFERTQLK